MPKLTKLQKAQAALAAARLDNARLKPLADAVNATVKGTPEHKAALDALRVAIGLAPLA